MTIVPFLFLSLSAVLMLLTWFNEGQSRRVVSITFSLFLFILGVMLIFVLNEESFIQQKNILEEKTRANNQLVWSFVGGIVGYILGWISHRRKYIKHDT